MNSDSLLYVKAMTRKTKPIDSYHTKTKTCRKRRRKIINERRKKDAIRKDRMETWREGPGDQPGIERNADAGPIDAGSAVVATTSTTIPLSLLFSPPL
jgi:hypothetical protein